MCYLFIFYIERICNKIKLLTNNIFKGRRENMLSKITINNVASFKRSTTLETDKKVNLLYGLNGVGKSTLSSFLYNPKSSRFSYCTMEGLNNDDTIWYTIKTLLEIIFMSQKG